MLIVVILAQAGTQRRSNSLERHARWIHSPSSFRRRPEPSVVPERYSNRGHLMNPEAFITSYERALATHRWDAVAPLIHDDAAVTFSDGSVHKGKAAIERAFERNFALIRDEKYAISNVSWIRKSPDTAVFVYDFAWEGRINGSRTQGAGVGTSVLVNDGGQWKLLVEHLGGAPAQGTILTTQLFNRE